MTTVVVFCGPSITAAEVGSHLAGATDAAGEPIDLVCLAPVAQGDVLRAVREHAPHTIAIIDGLFERVPSVWHKEILWALDGGVHVFGSSSMGALRAAELHPFGMVGVGRVFEQFRDGELDDDDEVAVLHGTPDDGHRSLSTAMVDLRDQIAGWRADGLLSVDAADAVLAAAKALPYGQRALRPAVREALAAGTIDEATADAIRATAATAGPGGGLKHRDALALLDVLATHLATVAGPFQPADWYVEPTVFLHAALQEVDRDLAVGPDGPTSSEGPGPVAEYVSLAGESLAVLEKQSLLRVLAREVASLHGIRLAPADVDEVVTNFRERYELADPEIMRAWLAEHGMTTDDFLAAATDLALVSRVERAHRHDVDAGVALLARFGRARLARVAATAPESDPANPTPSDGS